MANKKIGVGMLIIVLTFGLVLTGCPDINDNNNGQNGNENGTGEQPNGNGNGGEQPNGTVRSTKLYDKNNTFLGYCTFIETGTLLIISPKNYMYYLGWDGKLQWEAEMYFSGKDGSGNPYLVASYLSRSYGLIILSHKDLLYTPAEHDTNGLPKNVDIMPTLLSYYDSWSGMVNKEDDPDHWAWETLEDEDQKAYSVKTISKADAGIPETITLPLKVTFE